jgi:hypothetical protein
MRSKNFLKGAAVTLLLVFGVAATVKTTYRGTFVGDGSGLTGVPATTFPANGSVTNITAYGSAGKTNWVTIGPSGLWNTNNTAVGGVLLSGGTITASGGIAAGGYSSISGGLFIQGTVESGGSYWATNGGLQASGQVIATNGIMLMTKPSFTTNFTCTNTIQNYCCNGTNQIVTLPNAGTAKNVTYRFSITNGWAKVIITNATGTQTIRDGSSLSFTQVGIGSPSFFSDGAHWWSAARTKVIMPNASWSTSSNIIMTAASEAYPVGYSTTEFNNSQGLALAANATNAACFSQMWITNSGEYLITYSALMNAGHNGDSIAIWLKNAGTNVLRTATPICFSTTAVTNCVTVNYIVSVPSATYYELYCQATGTGCTLPAAVATGNIPAGPSIIVTVNKVSDLWP